MATTSTVLVWAGMVACSPADEAPLPPPDSIVSMPNDTLHHTNRLARQKSPYLLQHQHNPVDWYPWGQEAFDRARAERKPIFLSIGYSTCHWCHVMERESFENDAIAAFLNEHFVSIKVDREERPDVDKIYMTFVQATTGQGGWPLNVFLTPDLKPFFGGTYFPPSSGRGRPGFLEVLQQVQAAWTDQPDRITASAAEVHTKLEEFTQKSSGPGDPATIEALHNAARLFKSEYDPRHGGFGGAPKFPRPSQPAFLLRYGTRFQDPEAIRMVLHTCDRMAAGGMYDQLGGGFSRYSVDNEWLVPHFEKMLYDNAQLVHLYLDAFLISGKERYARVAREILGYVKRDMTHPEGGFYSAEDADSEGQEGKFYCWTLEELRTLLSPEELQVAQRYYGLTEKGNFIDHSHPQPLPNLNVLSIVDPKLSEPESALLFSADGKMLETRAHRVRPHLDDKVLASWNGMMLAAFARASAILGDKEYRETAEKNLRFVKDHLWDPKTRTLHHRWRDGERDSVQLLDAYAYLLEGVIELYSVTLEAAYLEFATQLADGMLKRFRDPEAGGFFQGMGTSDLILRVKEDYDGALPSGNSVAVLALLKLGAITDQKDYLEAGEGVLNLFSTRMLQIPQSLPQMLLALDFSLQEPYRIVLTGPAEDDSRRQLLRACHNVYQPTKVVLGQVGPVEPFAKTLPSPAKPVAYVCTGSACQPPTDNPTQLATILGSPIESLNEDKTASQEK